MHKKILRKLGKQLDYFKKEAKKKRAPTGFSRIYEEEEEDLKRMVRNNNDSMVALKRALRRIAKEGYVEFEDTGL